MRPQIQEIEWFDMNQGDSIGKFPTDLTLDNAPCPKCGKPCDYWEGQIGEDRMGNAEYGWSYDCYACKVHSEVKEL